MTPRTVVARLFAAAAALVATGLAVPAVSAAEQVALPGHVLPMLGDATLMQPAARRGDGAELTLTVVLRRNDEAAFQRDLAALYDPASPAFRKWMSPQQIADRYGPGEDDYAAVERHFVASGFAVVERSSNRMTLVVRAPRATVERALALRLADYVVAGAAGSGAREVVAPLEEPSLPPDIAARIHAIAGLSTLAQARRVGALDAGGVPRSPRVRPQTEAIRKAFCAVVDGLFALAGGTPQLKAKDVIPMCNPTSASSSSNAGSGGATGDARLAAASTAPASAQDPAPDPWLNITGAGQRIGLVQFDTYLPSDVADFAAMLGMPAGTASRVTRVAVNGGATLGANQSEVLLDIDFILPVASGATITVYDSPFTGAGSFQALFNRAIADGMTIISNSWAYCENETSAADVQSLDAIFAGAAAAGITILNASGDSGTTCLNGAPNTIAVPAGAPNATAVGGTTQQRGPGATLAGETWWDATTDAPPTGRSGYGLSRFFPRPAYQAALNPQPYRSIPDVVTNADPATGIFICQASDGGCPNGKIYGGTSMAAPSMAAYVALLNQARGANLGFVNPAFYPLAGTDAFRSPATLGVDFARAGIGSPNVNALHVALNGIARGPASAARTTVEAFVNYPKALTLLTLGGIPADGTTTLDVVVTVRDANGNTLPGKSVTLNASPPGVTITPPTTTTSVNNGAAIFSVKTLQPQTVSFTAQIAPDGVNVAPPAQYPFVVPPATAAGIQAFPTTVLNNGTATTTITVTLQDALGRPTPGKTVQLAQGSGRSVITAASPPVTDSAGQIQFTATNLHAETVTYTAVVVTDGDVPVPGTAVVNFSGSAATSCVGETPPAAGAGFAITPFITGFKAEAFFYSNVNWGCAGGNNPSFRPDGEVLVGSFRTGTLYRLQPEGGAVSSANAISAPGQTLGALVYGKDGKLYGFRGATGAGFFSGAIYEFDPATGATLRTLASGLSCISPLAVDPISGDLFFTGTCFGAGSDDPRLLRVQNPGSATPSVVTYATLPGTPNGAVSFSPDGTIYVAIKYLEPSPPVVRVSGTNQPQPPTITPITGLASIFWVTVAETLPNGAAKSLIVLGTDNKVKLADLSTSPPALTELITSGMSSGVIGPDGCVYTSNGETIFKLTQAGGACGFTPTNPVPAISLTPAVAQPNPVQGSSFALTARLVGMAPTAGVPVVFRVRGANDQVRLVRTDASGIAVLDLPGVFSGSDVIDAAAEVGLQALVSNTARVTWNAGQHTAFLSLNGTVTSSIAGASVQLTASLFDASLQPNTPIFGVAVQFNVAGQSCNGVTNANGVATCNVILALPGTYTLTATFAGTPGYTASASSTQFAVVPPPPGPCVTFNDVDADSPFCPSVAWIKNRSVTLGCQAALYCPVDAVSRLQMAAFMKRLGTSLSGSVLFTAATSGPVDLDTPPVVCQTDEVATGTYERRAVADGSFSATAPAALGFAAEVVASFDGGATWVPLAAPAYPGSATANHWGALRPSGTAELAAGQTVRFGLRVSRGGLPGTTDPTDSRCKLRVVVGNR